MRTSAIPVLALLLALLLSSAARAADDLPGRMRRQDALLAAGKGEEALAEAEALVKADPRNPEALYLLGRMLGNSGRVEEARSRFEGALELDINYAPAWRGLALVHMKRAMGMAEDAEALRKASPGPAAEKAAAEAKGAFDTSVREARKAFELDPGEESRVLLVQCLYESGDRPGAYRLLQEQISARPDDHDLRAFYGTLLFQERLYREAEKEFRQVLAAAPDHLPSRHLLVQLLVNTGRPGEAADQCREAAKLFPADPRFLLLLRDLLVDGGDYGGAAAAVEGILKRVDDPEKRALLDEDLRKLRAAAADPREPPAPDAEAILKQLESPDVVRRREAMRTLWEQELNFLPGAAVKCVSDPDETVRLYAVRLVSRYGTEQAAGLLEVILFHPKDRDSSAQVRAQAASGIGAIGGAAALPVLFRALEEPEPEILRSALLGIRAVTGKCLVDDPYAPLPEAERASVRERYRTWWMESPTGKHWRRKSAAAAGDSGMRSLVHYVVPWVLEDDPEIRAAVLDAMARLRKDPSFRDLPTGTTAEREAARDAAFKAMAGER